MKDPVTKDGFDVAIIGGGPAGIAAAIWCADLKMSCVLLDSGSTLGGQLNWISAPITNYPAITTENGKEMAARFANSLPDEVTVRSGDSVTKIESEHLAVITNDGERISAKTVVLATGIRRRELGVVGEREFRGRGVLFSGAGSKEQLRGQRVVIIGGGDAALENAAILSEVASKVTIIHRRDSFSARPEFLTIAKDRANVELIMSSDITSINGETSVRAVRCRSLVTGIEDNIATDAVLIRVGVKPNSELVRDFVECNDRGYIKVDRKCATNIPNIFAIGDISNPIAPTIAGAVGDAATAVKAAYSLLNASKGL